MSITLPPAERLAPGEANWATAGRDVTDVAFGHEGGMRWWYAFAFSLLLIAILVVCLTDVLFEGVGVWGNNIPVTWALDIVGYDWWIGVACGGLMVSALLLLLGARWRGAVNRITETMALISAAAAGLYPIVHLGRPWFFFWNLPYPNTMLLWPQFRSPLFWDAIDIISFLGVGLSFWYVGLLPDLATMRDRAVDRVEREYGRPDGWTRLLKAQLYGIAALGWRGSVGQWQRWWHTYNTLAVCAIVVVLALQTGAAVMFAGTVEPGWHDTLQPVIFVVAALFAGVGMVSALLVTLRYVFPLSHLIVERHIALLATLLLGLGLAMLYCYGMEFGMIALTGDSYDKSVSVRRFFGDHAWAAWAIIVCALLPVQLFWIPALRRSASALFAVGLLVAFAMWADHYTVIVVTLQHDFLPSMAHPYKMNLIEIGTFVGTIGLFLFLLLLAVRYLPVISLVGVRRSFMLTRRG